MDRDAAPDRTGHPHSIGRDADLIKVDVVIVAFGSPDSISERVREAWNEPTVASVSVVDHGDGAGAAAGAAEGAGVVHDPSNPGFGAGQNRGVALGRAPYLLLLNPDAELVPGAIRHGIEVVSRDAGVAAVQGVIFDPDTGQPDRSAGPQLTWVDLWGRALGLKALLRMPRMVAVARRLGIGRTHTDRVPRAPIDVDTLAATAVLVRRAAFERVGGFDESYFLYGEDLDLSWRLRRAGWRLVSLPVEWAAHRNGSASADWARREVSWWEGTLRFAALRWNGFAFAAARAAGLVMLIRIALVDATRAREAGARMVVGPGRVRRSRACGRARPSPIATLRDRPRSG